MTAVNRKTKLFILLGTFGLLALATSGCGTHYTHAFKTDIKNIEDLKVIALVSVELPFEHPKAVEVKRFFDKAIADKLATTGFRVINQDIFADKMVAISRVKGGAFDPVTGKKDEKKFADIQKTCVKEISKATGAKVLLRAKVEPVSVPFGGCRAARWDGAMQEVSKTFGIFCATSNIHGRVPGLSLLVVLEDLDGNALYFHGGGIQLATRFVNRFPIGGFERLPVEQLLTDEVRNRQAVDLSLAPLLSSNSKQ